MSAGKRGTRLGLGCVVLFILYFGTAQLGFSLWPAVFAGALLVNLTHGAPLLVAAGIASGNTLEALLGAWLLGRIRFQPGLDRVLDVLALILAAAIGSTAVSAFVGVGSLRLGGIVGPREAGAALRAWWIGDALGDLVVAPLLFLLRARPPLRRLPAIVPEALLLLTALVTFGLLVFGNLLDGLITYRHPYLLFPLLAWAALRFGQYGAALSVFLVSAIAITGTTLGYGPFVQPVLADSLLGLQTFMGVAAATALVLGAA